MKAQIMVTWKYRRRPLQGKTAGNAVQSPLLYHAIHPLVALSVLFPFLLFYTLTGHSTETAL